MSLPGIECVSESQPRTGPPLEKDPADRVTGDEPATGAQE